MLTELCQELRNWFDRDQPKWYGDFEIENGALVLSGDMSLKDGQYFRIVGSALNDGVYQYNMSGESAQPHLVDEEFTGAVWAMAVPPTVVALSADIEDWIGKYGDVVNSPFQSESFGGYTYSKASGGSNSGVVGSGVTWQAVFHDRLNRWRKI